MRRPRPIAALLKKEFQLHSISLLCACALLGLHIAVFLLRVFYSNSRKNSLASVASDSFWILWLFMPLIIGSTAVAEERNLGVAEAQLCLPVSRRSQFVIKFIPILIFGMLLGGVMPVLLEAIVAHLGAPNEYFAEQTQANNEFGSGLLWFPISIVALSAGLAWVGFFASTLARNFLQALSIAILTVLGCLFFSLFLIFFMNPQVTIFGITPWHSILPFLIAIPTIPAVLLWLAWRNFSHFNESWPLWRRNILGLTGAVVFVIVGSAAIYNRVWEVFEPAEPPHGPAIFSSANMPTLRGDGQSGLQVRFPDGRIWFDSLGYPFFKYQFSRWHILWWTLVRQPPVSTGPQQFIAGSNWVSATTFHVQFWNPAGGPRQVTGYLDTVGVQPDGTLWISSEAKPVVWTGARMIRFGDETNWQQVVRKDVSLLLLKRNGTLWQWGTNRLDWSQWQTNWPTVRASKPQQIGTDSDWREICNLRYSSFARKKDGGVWQINWDGKVERETNLDQIVLQTFSDSGNNSLSYTGKNGTLWTSYGYFDKNGGEGTRKSLQVGKETNWVATTIISRLMTWNWMVSLKSDGSLWQWNFAQDSTTDVSNIPPIRLGIHNDWVGLTATPSGAISLAADGSLWYWPLENAAYFSNVVNGHLFDIGDLHFEPLLDISRKPQPLGNIFGKAD